MRLRVGEAEAGQRLDQVAATSFGVPRAQVQRWARSGHLQLNGAAAKPSAQVREGDTIEADPPDPVASEVLPEPIPLAILFEDDAVIVLDKPAGMVVHPAPGHSGGTLVNALLHHCGDLAGIGGVMRPGIVHRLDRGTSGVMVVAKHDAAHLALAEQFQSHEIDRLYRTWVRTVPNLDRGHIDQPIGRHPRDRKRMSIVTRHGREARTNWEVEKRYLASGIARLAIRPETGRTHQIRVHLSSNGMPLLGDDAYGKGRRAKGPVRFDRPALHAACLGFIHPVTAERLSFEAELPADLRELEARLEVREA
ncbi:MAG: RluA family pseudouridine synthase [bacterium]|nr:RluA family pseudouridine synthase [bacterium]